MKKVLAIMLVLVMLLGVAPLSAFAQKGPNSEQIYGEYYTFLRAMSADANGKYYDNFGNPTGEVYTFFADNRAYDNVCKGVSYDEKSNILTFDNDYDSNLKLVISANMMGDDFTIRIDGRCALGCINVWGDGYGGNLTITGNGELTVNENKFFCTAINMYAEGAEGKVTFGKDVKVKLFAQKGEKVVVTESSTVSNPAEIYTFEVPQSLEVKKEGYAHSHYDTRDCVYMDDPDYKCWAGQLVQRASDPKGIYAVSTGYRDDPNDTLYWVAKYEYVERFNAYLKDYSFASDDPKRTDFGELEFTEKEWLEQKEYKQVGTPSDEAEVIEFQDDDFFGTNYYHTAGRLSRTSDPDGLYGYVSRSTSDEGSFYNVDKFIYSEEHNCYIIDDSFAEVKLPENELGGEYSIVYGVNYEDLSWVGNVQRTELPVYEDTSGNKYIVDYNDNVYDFDENDKLEIGSDLVYAIKKNAEVSVDSLVRTEITEIDGKIFNYYIDSEQLIYNSSAHIHNFNKAEVVKPTATQLGYTQYKCSCGQYKADSKGALYKDNFTAPIGKPSGLKCAAGTASAMKFTWTKTAGVNGYQIQLLTSAGKSAGLKALTANSYTFSKLAAGHAYKARVRFYITKDGKNYYGAWTTINSPTLPAGTAITKLTPASKAFTAQWKKGACTGYQLQYATNAKFTGAKAVTIKNVKTLKYALKKLSAKKTYYVRVRTYKTINKVNYFSAWSGAKKVKTK